MPDFSHLMGWEGHDKVLLAEAFASLPPEAKQPFRIVGKEFAGPHMYPMGVRRMMLFEVAQLALGQYPSVYFQKRGDCVSFATKNATEYLAAFQIANGIRSAWKVLFAPYFYGISRHQIGRDSIGRSDGSIGAWAAQGACEYGVLSSDAPGCPEYDANVAGQWGMSGPPSNFIQIGKEHLVGAVAPIRTWEEAITALCNGYPVSVCSNVGYDMKQRSDGFMHYSTTWQHAMALTGIDDGGDGVEPHACIQNSWGDAFGEIRDFRNKNLVWPKGTIRVRKGDLERMLSQEDSWSFSGLNGFEAQQLPIDFFSSF